MKPDILEVEPQELKFTFEVKKQSSCSVQLINKTHNHVAFKVKTTNPKKYCVRPNTGVILPNSSCEFSVTMQAPKVAPPDLICRDKFLVQSTAVPQGTKEEDVTSNTFAKEDGKIVDEKRLKVLLISPPESPESSPINETLKLLQDNEVREPKDDVVQKHSSQVRESKDDIVQKHSSQVRELKDDVIQNHGSHAKVVNDDMEVSKGDGKFVDTTKKEESVKRKEEAVKRNEEPLKQSKEFIRRNEEPIQINDIEEQKLVKDVEEMKSKVKDLEAKLTEAKATILHLTEEKRSATQEKHLIQGELDLLRSKRHRAQVGFPLLFVFMVALIGMNMELESRPGQNKILAYKRQETWYGPCDVLLDPSSSSTTSNPSHHPLQRDETKVPVRCANTPEAMNSEEGNDSLNNFLRISTDRFPTRKPFYEFVERYKILAPDVGKKRSIGIDIPTGFD
uniref:Vesicle-associated protein 2-2-like isoform X1 n=1 Tax=Tanacetum cinerariifolium TaxID=118510 RepID=A0A6L2KWC6_TANCI|nr:vesicle-associated protein 2-2-like isoform X1 [Tanacetum cinerariifolium]